MTEIITITLPAWIFFIWLAMMILSTGIEICGIRARKRLLKAYDKYFKEKDDEEV